MAVWRRSTSTTSRSAAQRLRDEGVDVGTVLELAGQMRLVDVFDPDGNRVQLTEEIG